MEIWLGFRGGIAPQPSEEKYEEFLSLLKNRSEYQFEVDLNKDDKILTLSTCYKESDRVVLHAKLIKMEVKNGNN